ncbi:GNAT family N-acetyltransferase [Defluviimonas sp. WL0002]|uniref:L-ornithine N(alpha)-acyltransferase n=1 Tax=Albidovulum marisflavi TaxID=2984159 RepID=A0ABT2ZC96_9RHOB|nr:GNAT family N-acyltransferase [Defluviimonas sp. WL0002]MCV2868642.1 GNAT family N-acetyltransferase [Defluviimonas sp. WL0002]
MSAVLERGRYLARFAASPADLDAVLSLRAEAFRGGADDRDALDGRCLHLMVTPQDGGPVLASCRVLVLQSGQGFRDSYSAGFYEVGQMACLTHPVAEVGRLCLSPAAQDPDVLRLLWAALTRRLGAEGVACLFGCCSFRGADPARHAPALGLLATRHLLQSPWQVRATTAERVALAGISATDPDTARSGLPPLLRSYLAMGGRVGQEAVIDRDLDTLHVFTLVDVAAMPAARLAALQALSR